MKVSLPANAWVPRPYQQAAWGYLEQGGKRASLWWHRRSGKDEVCLHRTAIAMCERVGNYWHMLPQSSQARKSIWNAVNPHTGMRRIDEVFPLALRKQTLDNEMLIRLHNGSTWQVIGSDNYKMLVGSPPIGIVMSEWSKAQPQAWAYLSPILLENNGWAIFPTTPMGKNHAWRTHQSFRDDPDAFCETLTVADTGVFTAKGLAGERQDLIDVYGHTLGSALYAQEYECSAEAAVLGSIYAYEIAEIRRTGRIRELAVADAPVHTAWDLGRTDATAVWFFQRIGSEIRVLDYYTDNLQNSDHYAEQITGRTILNPMSEWAYGTLPVHWGADIPGLERRRKYNYGVHYLPHDAAHKTLSASGVSTEQILRKVLGNVQVVQVKNDALISQISAGRQALRQAWFDPRTEDGLEVLSLYRYGYDEHRMLLSTKPIHDWTSHGADAWRIVGLVAAQESAKRVGVFERFGGRKAVGRKRGTAWSN